MTDTPLESPTSEHEKQWLAALAMTVIGGVLVALVLTVGLFATVLGAPAVTSATTWVALGLALGIAMGSFLFSPLGSRSSRRER